MKSRRKTNKQVAISINREFLPEHVKNIPSVDKALEVYCKELLVQCKTPAQSEHLLLQIYPDQAYVEVLVSSQIEELHKNKKDLFEQMVHRGLQLALAQNNLKAYFTGLGLLKDLYGVHRNVITTIKEDRPRFMSSAFLDLKNDEETVEVSVASELDKV